MTRSYTLRSSSCSLSKSRRTGGLSGAPVKPTEPTLLQTVTHDTQEAGVRSLERAIGRIVRYKVVEWAAYAGKEGRPPSSSPPPSPTASLSETSKALVKRSKDLDAGYNPVVEATEPEKILGMPRYGGEDHDREPR